VARPRRGRADPDPAGAEPIESVERFSAQPVTRDDADVEAAVASVLAGDREAFRMLVERESSHVVRTCYRILGDLPDAEDAAQEAFVIAYRSLGSWRGSGPFGAWIARIAVRLALRHASRRKALVRLEPSVTDRDTRGAANLAATSDGTRHDPVSMTIRHERAAAVRLAVGRLHEPYREVVALRFFGELSLAEIAATSGRPLGTVKTHLHRGLRRLRETLEAGGYEE
jgi:RNA polymerase sigma-70 factor (ECF subfamily)